MSVIRSYFFCFLAIDNDIMRKMCTLITSKGTDIDENIANQNHATRTRTPKPGYLNLSIFRIWTGVPDVVYLAGNFFFANRKNFCFALASLCVIKIY